MNADEKRHRGRPQKGWVDWHLQVPAALKERVRRRAAARNVPMNEVVVEALEEFLRRP